MDNVELTVQPREAGKKPHQLRHEDVVPCVMYGNEVENTSFQCDHNTLYKAYVKAGESTIVNLNTGSKTVPVLFHAIDFHPVSEKVLHADFYAVNMKKEVETTIALEFVGEAPVVKELGGVLVTVIDHVTVRCLPADLPHSIEIDISSLKTFEDGIPVSEIKASDKVEILDDPEQLVVTAQEPRRAVEETAEEEAAEGEEAEGTEEAAKEEGSDS